MKKSFQINVIDKTIKFDLHGKERVYHLTKSSNNRLYKFIEKNKILVFGNNEIIFCDLWLSGYYH